MKFSFEKSQRTGCNSLEMQLTKNGEPFALAMNQEQAEIIVAQLNNSLSPKAGASSEEGFALHNLAKVLLSELKTCVKLVQKHGTDPQYAKVTGAVKKAETFFSKTE